MQAPLIVRAGLPKLGPLLLFAAHTHTVGTMAWTLVRRCSTNRS